MKNKKKNCQYSISNRVFCFISEMSNPIVRFDGIEANFIDEKQLQLTVKLVPQGLDTISYNDLFLILEKEGVRPEDILGLYKVSANDYSFSLFLSNEGTVNSLRDKKVIGNSKVKLNVISMAEQIVTLRVHWLPLYYDNRLLKAILCEYGEILDIRMCKSSHANLVAMNGMREVTIKTDEVTKQKIPHLFTFSSGQSILITMRGRSPLCLKCREVGHVRRDCEDRRSFARITAGPGPSDMPVGRPVASQSLGSPVVTAPVPQGPVDATEPRDAGTGDRAIGNGMPEDQRQNVEEDEMPDQREEVADTEMSEGNGSSKRGSDSFDDDFITPNKTAKARSLSEEGTPLMNSFSPIMGISDLMEGDDLSQDQ